MEWDWDWEIVDGLSDFMEEGAICFVIGGVLRMLLFIFKLLLFAGYYTLPIWIVIFGFSGGAALGSAKGQDVYDKYEREAISDLTHTVTIYTDNGSHFEIRVREDQHWTVDGSLNSSGVPYEYDEYVGTPDGDTNYVRESGLFKSGKRFLGLYTSPDGGTCFANGAGYGIKDVTGDMTLYAVYETISN